VGDDAVGLRVEPFGPAVSRRGMKRAHAGGMRASWAVRYVHAGPHPPAQGRDSPKVAFHCPLSRLGRPFIGAQVRMLWLPFALGNADTFALCLLPRKVT
jgi:hypothetical protein